MRPAIYSFLGYADSLWYALEFRRSERDDVHLYEFLDHTGRRWLALGPEWIGQCAKCGWVDRVGGWYQWMVPKELEIRDEEGMRHYMTQRSAHGCPVVNRREGYGRCGGSIYPADLHRQSPAMAAWLIGGYDAAMEVVNGAR